ncbi:hypothetical protein Prudu_1041S000400 [Prunus dulcis]|uniref:Uncharacterized protein n=1 Tax=Prunus dulcis TaxID=3755 RepID=A0A5H2Y5Z1_PRUDU|nr:hypothetical protein Prudu_1041S000400 [Prunus dulcis]
MDGGAGLSSTPLLTFTDIYFIGGAGLSSTPLLTFTDIYFINTDQDQKFLDPHHTFTSGLEDP